MKNQNSVQEENIPLSILINLLGCKSKDIASYGNINPSSFSKLKKNRRTTSSNSPLLHKISTGFYLYSINNNQINQLADFLQINPSSSESEFVQVIKKYLITDKNIRNANEPSMFAENLNTIMLILHIKNLDFAKACHVAPSTISRFRTGYRFLHPNSTIYNLIVDNLAKEAKKQGKEGKILEILKVPSLFSSLSLEELLQQYLKGPSEHQYSTVFTQFLEKIYRFQFDETLFKQLPPSFMDHAIEMKNNYTGIEGLQASALRFLYEQTKIENGEIWLFSDQDVRWMTSSEEYMKSWSLLMIMVLQKGNRIKIIHNLDRKGEDLFTAIDRWLPIYFTGQIDSYYAKSPIEGNFNNTLFLSPGNFAIRSSSYKANPEAAIYPFITNKKMLVSLAEEFQGLLSDSIPLLKILDKHSPSKCATYEDFFTDATYLHFYSEYLPLWFLSEEQVFSLIKTNHFSSKTKDELLEFFRIQKTQILQSLSKGYPVTQYLVIPESCNSPAETLNTKVSLCCDHLDITLTRADYLKCLETLKHLEEKYPSLSVLPLDSTQSKGLSFDLIGHYCVLHKSTPPKSIIVFNHPHLGKSFIQFLLKQSESSLTNLSQVMDYIIKKSH